MGEQGRSAVLAIPCSVRVEAVALWAWDALPWACIRHANVTELVRWQRPPRGSNNWTWLRCQQGATLWAVRVPRSDSKPTRPAVGHGLRVARRKTKTGRFRTSDDRRRAWAHHRRRCRARLKRFEARATVLAEPKPVNVVSSAATAPHPPRGTRSGANSQVLPTVAGGDCVGCASGHDYLPARERIAYL